MNTNRKRRLQRVAVIAVVLGQLSAHDVLAAPPEPPDPVAADPAQVVNGDLVAGADIVEIPGPSSPGEQVSAAPVVVTGSTPNSVPSVPAAEFRVRLGGRDKSTFAGSNPDGRPAPVQAESSPWKVSLAGASAKQAGVSDEPVIDARLTTLPNDALRQAGLQVFAFQIDRSDVRQESVSLAVEVSLAPYAAAYGGDWLSRAQLVELPRCATTIPRERSCQALPKRVNSTVDRGTGVLSANLSVPTAGSSGAVTYGVMAASASPMGDWSATPFSSEQAWQVGVGSGDFSWSYPFEVPPAAAGATPSLALSYSSQSVDAMTEASNNQGGEFGIGWGLSGTGFVERTYSTCANASRCWRSAEELSLSLNGHSSQLVPTGSNDEWRLKSDPGWRVRRLKNAPDSVTMPNDSNGGPNTGEYWVVTTPDGTQYFFGYGREGATQYETNARWSVPVYQVPGCSGWCYKPWRWNLDRIVDTNGNVTSMLWDPEFNYYGAGGAPYSPVRYVRGGVLAVVAYGKRAGSEATAPPTRIVVHTQPRCVQLTSCPALTVTNAASYPDVPVDQVCTAAPCYSSSPTFFTSRRVDYIETYAPDPTAGGAQHVVSRYVIGNSFVQNSLQGDQRLWLGFIQRVGLPNSNPLWAPAVQFASYWAN